MMKYTTYETTGNQTFTAKSHIDAYRTLCGKLSVDGYRAITAIAENGAIVHASLYLDESYIKNKNGVKIYES